MELRPAMLKHILGFEIGYWLRGWMVWIFLFIIALLFFFADGTDYVTIGTALDNTFRNSAFNIQNFYSVVTFFTAIMAPAFLNSAAARDFSLNTYQILFSTPLRRFDFLLGRFLGATMVSAIPMLGVSLAVLLAKYMPWVEAERWGPVLWSAHLKGFLYLALPNAVIFAAIIFAVAVLAKNEIVSFIAVLVLLAGYGTADALLRNVDYEKIAALLDPFGIRTFAYVTKYWTVAEKNSNVLSFSGLLLWNRVIWLSVAAAMFALAYSRFSFTERSKKIRTAAKADPAILTRPVVVALPVVTLRDAPWRKFLASLKIDFLGVVKSTPFIVIIAAALLNCIPAVALDATSGYGNSTFPVTYWIIELIQGTLYAFLLAVAIYYAGVLAWKDRDCRMDEITDALPSPEWVTYGSRLVSLLGIIMTVLLVALVSGVIIQAAHGFHRFQLLLYVKEMLFRDASIFVFYSVLAFFIHTLAPNKYLGYFAYLAFIIANIFIWRPLNIATHMVRFGGRPNIVYSDFYADAPFRLAWDWFTLYWICFAALLAILTVMFWPRGKHLTLGQRTQNARLRFNRSWRALTLLFLAGFAASGAWVYYNTKIVNVFEGPKDVLRAQAEYEKKYKQFEKQLQPRTRSLKYAIDLYPETRSLTMTGDAVLENAYAVPLEEIHFSLDRDYNTFIEIPGASLAKNDERLAYRVYKFAPPMQPGEKRTAHFVVKTQPRGFENELTKREVVEDGTFFNNGIGPTVGYRSDRELTDPNDRKKYGLGEQVLMPPLERHCTTDCMENYIGGHTDWVDMETVISTSADQTAVAPGSLVRQWQENGRNFYDYKFDHQSLAFGSFISARYEVAREEWQGIKIEVYYIREHPWNVGRMLKSIEKSLDYYTKNFGPYYHKEARIIEFPRVAQFAQAFPGTMPYSESIGFIANLDKPDDIDMVYYVVAHEMGHQWWAHQVIGANMEGATLLSETMAQYSALMVMEKEYGRDIMRKFLRYEMDNYLANRGRERQKERPLLTVEAEQGYVHYRKGSVVLYYLKEMIGEQAVDRALRKMVEKYAYAEPPYPTSWDLLDALSEQTPPQYQYLLKDLFEDITIFSNRTTDASAIKRADGKYNVTIKIETHKYKADPKGNETEVPVDDWIDIGAFAAPEKKKKYGKTLYRQRVHLTGTNAIETFTVDEAPEQAGVDPFLLLIDRLPDDNVRKVSISSAPPASGK
jgi:ABC-2 type transport system permease protein